MMPNGVESGQPDVYSNDSPGRERRLLADDARTLDLVHLAGAVGDDPVARQQLRPSPSLRS